METNELRKLKNLYLSPEWDKACPIFKKKVYELAGSINTEFLKGMKKIIEMPEEAYRQWNESQESS